MEKEKYAYNIEDYMPLIIKTVSEVTGRYVEMENSIELGIVLEKFYRVQEHYNPEKGPFIPYIKTVMRNAVLDYMRSEKNKQTVPVDAYDTYRSNDSDVHDAAQLRMYEKVLKRYGISYGKLAAKAPVHHVTRCKLVDLAKAISEEVDLVRHIKEKKKLPISKICSKFDVTQKVVKTHKIYLLAVVLAYEEGIESVVKWIEGQCMHGAK